ncbi:hypothetical protein ABKN59_001667 [Abortiporus biennis]
MTSFGEVVAPTAAINAILGTYPFSIGLLREILQNSDDAKASKQVFVLDYRTYPGLRLIDPRLVEAQGPSLLAYNNATFEDEDWIALQRINESSKREDTSKIGKYGVGFRSCYHITDTPQILSGSSLAILDPHRAYGPGGYKVDFITDFDVCADHLAAFYPSQFDSTWTAGKPFEGTIIRLPLRQDASWSRISTKTLDPKEIKKLLLDFIKEEIDIAMLFLSHISSVNIVEVDNSGRRQLVKVEINRTSLPSLPSSQVGVERVERCTVLVDDDSEGVPRHPQDWCILHVTFPIETCTEVLSTNLGPNTASRLQREKLKPILGLAVPLPLSLDRSGRLFTYLPLPLPTGFPLHIHALFALTQARQNLWSCSEKGMVHGTRDELLVEWNKSLFEIFIPKAWAYLLPKLLDDLKTSSDIFHAWPPQSQRTPGGDPAYWQLLAFRTLQYIIEDNLAVWPLAHSNSIVPFGSKNSTFIATSADAPLLQALANAGIHSTVPPAYIVDMLRTHEMDCKWLNPTEVQAALLDDLPSVSNLRVEDKAILLSYLASDGNLERLIGIPVIPLANGSYAALQKPGYPSYVYLDDTEAHLFADYDNSAIRLSQLSPYIQKLFRSTAPNSVNITSLQPFLVLQYLPKVFETYGLSSSVSSTTPEAMIIWLHHFWEWLSSWQDREVLFSSLQHFTLLPNSSGVHQVLSDTIFKPEGIASSTQSILLRIGIPFVHPKFPSLALVFLELNGIVKSIHNLAPLVENLHIQKIGELDESGIQVLLSHLSESLTHHRGFLSQRCIQRMKCLPIYPNFTYRHSTTVIPIIKYGAIPTDRNLVSINVPEIRILSLNGSVLLPYLNGSGFVASQRGNLNITSILSYLGAHRGGHFSDIQLIDMFIAHLHEQPKELQRLFLQCLDRHRHYISPAIMRSLSVTKFIVCGRGSTLTSPQDTIDPSSSIATIFQPDDSCVPFVYDEEDRNIIISLRSLGLLCASLNKPIVSERLRSISRSPPQSARKLAIRLLTILNESRFDCSGVPELRLPWLPTGSVMSEPSACRDINKYHDRALFDRVLRIVDAETVQVTSRPLRKALGWDLDIPLQVIKDQLSAELEDQHSAVSSKRLSTIIVELGRRVNEIRSDANLLAQLREVTSQRPWIPVNNGTRARTRQAILDHQIVPPGFYHIPARLASTEDTIDFLRLMGCSDRPSNRAIFDELRGMDPNLGSAESVDVVVNLLHAIDVGSLTDDDRRQILAPDCHGCLRTLSELYLDDLGPRACQVELPANMYKLHGEVHQRLATRLMIQTLTSLNLKQFEDFDDDDMQENLCTRINNVLRQYSIDQAFNEFLANAEDAGATEYNILLDEKPGKDLNILAPSMAKLQSSPSLIIHNDAVFKDGDFVGIREVGLGSKQGRNDAIGKFGLGALSMFHFTETAMVVSGGHILFLDPSRKHLPASDTRSRSALKVPLSHIRSIHHDHLEILHGLFGFDKSLDYYDGTLFRLPLRSTGQSEISSTRQSPYEVCVLMENYEQRAAQSVLFIQVNTITASRRDASGQLSNMWSIDTTHQSHSTTGTLSHKTVIVSRLSTKMKHRDRIWHVACEDSLLTDLPEEFNSLIEKHRLRHTSVAIAALVSPSSNLPRRHVLYSKLPLPMLTSLPVHIDASFILADDRRSIRFEEGGQINPESRYNSWIFSTRVPPVYYYLLALWPNQSSNIAAWPGNVKTEDRISSLLIKSFYEQLASSTSPFCQSLTGERLLPSSTVFQDTENEGVKHILDVMKPGNVAQVPPHIRSRLPHEGIRRIDVAFLRELITENQDYLASILKEGKIGVLHIHEVVKFMVEDSPDSLINLKILPLADESLGLIKTSGNPSFFHGLYPPFHPLKLFPASRFVHPDFRVPLSWSVNGYNIEHFHDSSVISLLREYLTECKSIRLTSEEEAFVSVFWDNFRSLPVKIAQISGFPLVRTQSGNYISIDECHAPSTIIYNDTRRPWLGILLERLGATVIVKNTCSSLLQEELAESEFNFEVVTKFLQTLGTSRIPTTFQEKLTLKARRQFAEYARSHISYLRRSTIQLLGSITSTIILQDVARQLPIWEMFPSWLPHGIIKPFIDPNAAKFVAFNPDLKEILGVEPLSANDLAFYFRFPTILPQHQLPMFKDLLTALLVDAAGSTPTQISLKVPDTDRIMVNVDTLYAHSQPLFRSTFAGNLQYFLHPTLRNLESSLIIAGLKCELNLSSFKSCAQFVDSEVKQNGQSLGAAAVFDCYSRLMWVWATVGNNRACWEEVSDLAFIPRSNIRRHYDNPNFTAEDYAVVLPHVVSPSRILRSEYEAIAWTQRALFEGTPSEQLLLANTSLGVPTSVDVVEHLRTLVVIADSHPLDVNIASDLTETYRWLSNHIPECHQYLLRLRDEKLFLNVDSTTLAQSWNFCSAAQLVFNAPDEGTRKQVRRYLLEFKELLLKVGAKKVIQPVRPALQLSPAEEVLLELRTSLNEQRKGEILTDATLESTDGQMFPVHRNILVASTEYFKGLFCGEFRESSQLHWQPIHVDVSGDVLAQILDHIYLGKIQDVDDQDDLLEMLEVSDMWMLKDLFKWVENRLILTITIGTYKEVVRQAQKYHADALLAACQQFVSDNAEIL